MCSYVWANDGDVVSHRKTGHLGAGHCSLQVINLWGPFLHLESPERNRLELKTSGFMLPKEHAKTAFGPSETRVYLLKMRLKFVDSDAVCLFSFFPLNFFETLVMTETV